jgi:hypothetical protein
MTKSKRFGEWRACSWLVVLALMAVLTTAPAHAQLLQGALEGNVTDASQAAVVGAEVTSNIPTTEQLGQGGFIGPWIMSYFGAIYPEQFYYKE